MFYNIMSRMNQLHGNFIYSNQSKEINKRPWRQNTCHKAQAKILIHIHSYGPLSLLSTIWKKLGKLVLSLQQIRTGQEESYRKAH